MYGGASPYHRGASPMSPANYSPYVGGDPYGQYPVQRSLSYGAPSGADPMLWQWFSAVDSDRSGTITATELQSALVNGNWTNFDLDTVKMLLNIFDTDRNGTITFNEFAGLWKYISDWQNVFRHFDRDQSGSIDARELAEALTSFGYRLPSHIIRLIERKYASPPSYDSPPGITFDRFVRACVVVKTLTESFERMDMDRDGYIRIDYPTFMQAVLSAP